MGHRSQRRSNRKTDKENNLHQTDDALFTRMRKSIWLLRMCDFFHSFLRDVDLKTYMQMIYNAKQKATTPHHTSIKRCQNWKYFRSFKWGLLKQQAIRIAIHCVSYWRCLFWFCFRFSVLLNSHETIDSVIGQSSHEYAWDVAAMPVLRPLCGITRESWNVLMCHLLQQFSMQSENWIGHIVRCVKQIGCAARLHANPLKSNLNAMTACDRVPKTPAHGIVQCFDICMLQKLRGRSREHKTEMVRLDGRVPKLDYSRSRN